MFENNNKTRLIKEIREFSTGLDIRQVSIVDHLVHYRNMFAAPEYFIRRKVDYSKMRVFNEKYRKESERLETFNKFYPENLKHLIPALVKSGFYCTQNEDFIDQVKCIFCQGTLEKWVKVDIPMKRHKFSYPTCPFIISLNVANEPANTSIIKLPQEDYDLGNFKKDTVIKAECTFVMPRLNKSILGDKLNYLDMDWRDSTFENNLKLKNFSKTGLFVRKKDNESFLECGWCEKSTEILEGIEDLDESLFHRKTCSRQSLPIEDESEKNDEASKKFCKVEYSVTPQEIDARTETYMIYELINKRLVDISKDDIKVVIEKRLKEKGKDFESIYAFIKAIKKYSKDGAKSSIAVENVSNTVTLAEFQCVVCLDKVVEIIFLPCGHLKTCESCSDAMVTCPVCRVIIERRVKNMRFNDSSFD